MATATENQLLQGMGQYVNANLLEYGVTTSTASSGWGHPQQAWYPMQQMAVQQMAATMGIGAWGGAVEKLSRIHFRRINEDVSVDEGDKLGPIDALRIRVKRWLDGA